MNKTQFRGATTPYLVCNNTRAYLVAKTRAGRYAHSFKLSEGSLEDLLDRFVDFYHPLYLRDLSELNKRKV